MKTTYLLPCPACQENFQVEASDSGTKLHCQCGANVEVPALRRLVNLPKVVMEEPMAAVDAWGGKERGLLVGGVLLLIGLGIGLFWTIKGTPTVWQAFNDRERALLDIDSPDRLKQELKPAEVFQMWVDTQRPNSLDYPKPIERFHSEGRVIRWWRAAGYILAALGGAIMLGAWLLGTAKRQRMAARIPGPRSGPITA